VIIIDRFEGESVILEDTDIERFMRVERVLLPEHAREGDVVEEKQGAYTINSEATAERRRKIVERLKQMGL